MEQLMLMSASIGFSDTGKMSDAGQLPMLELCVLSGVGGSILIYCKISPQVVCTSVFISKFDENLW